MFNLHIFGVFSVILLCLFHSGLKANIVCFQSFKSVQVCIMAEKAVCVVVVHLHLGRMCNLLLEAVIYWAQSSALERSCCWVELYHYWSYGWQVCSLWRVDYWSLQLCLWVHLFLVRLTILISHSFRICCLMHVQNCYMLHNWSPNASFWSLSRHVLYN
jgi:hypothetical protein